MVYCRSSNPPVPEFWMSIIIVSYNTKDLLVSCLASVKRELQDFGYREQCELIVVDNNSMDGSGVMVKERFPCVHLILNRENLGFARANNLAIKRAKGRYLFFLNPDAEMCPGSLKIMINYMETHEEIGLAGTALIFPDHSHQSSVETSYPGSHHAKQDLPDLPGTVAWVLGASMIARTSLIKEIGGFDERFFLYGEDIDLCLAVRKNGFAIGHISDAVIIHHGAQSEKESFSIEVFEKKLRAAVLFFQKHYSDKSIQRIKRLQILQARWRLFSLTLERFIFPGDPVRKRKLEQYKRVITLYQSML